MLGYLGVHELIIVLDSHAVRFGDLFKKPMLLKYLSNTITSFKTEAF